MRVFASMLELLGIIVCPSRERNGDRYYELEKRDDYKVLRSLGAGHDFFWLHQRLQAFPASIGLLLKYRERIPHWVRFTNIFQSIEKPTYDWIELKDGYYNIHSNVFRMKDDPDFEFIRVCFRSYPYTVEQVKTKKPERWLKLLDYVCEKVPVKRLIDPADPFEASTIQYDQVDRERLLRDFALLLRRRKPKQPVPFLYGVSNSGKTTLTSFIRCIYPIEAIAAINNSSAPFSGISEDTMLVYNEEFKCETISREELLVLLDGAQPLTVRKLHQDARLIANPLMPIILQDNYYPTYYHDDSKALENRLSIHYFPRSIGSVDLEEYSRIADEHLFVIRHLHEYLELQENAPRTSA
jgi:phage/plasmid-associated DNA primase